MRWAWVAVLVGKRRVLQHDIMGVSHDPNQSGQGVIGDVHEFPDARIAD